MRIAIHTGARRRIIETTLIGIDKGALLTDDYLDMTALDTDGLLLERDVFTTTDDDAMAVKPEPIVILEPDELTDVDLVEVDGMPLLAREGDDLAPALLDSLVDENGLFLGDAGRGLRIYYRSGSIEMIDPVPLSYADGHIARDDQIDCGDLTQGVVWDCGVWTVDESGLMALKPEAIVVANPDLLKSAVYVTFSGELICMQDADGIKSTIGVNEKTPVEGDRYTQDSDE